MSRRRRREPERVRVPDPPTTKVLVWRAQVVEITDEALHAWAEQYGAPRQDSDLVGLAEDFINDTYVSYFADDEYAPLVGDNYAHAAVLDETVIVEPYVDDRVKPTKDITAEVLADD